MMEHGQIRLGDPLQIGVCVRNVKKTAELFSTMFGIGPWEFGEWPLKDRPQIKSMHRGSSSPEWKAKLAFTKFGNIELELIENVEGQSGYGEFLSKKGEGLHHLMFAVDDFEKIVSVLKSSGFDISTSATGTTPGSRWAIIDTLDTLGFNLEVVTKGGLR